MINTQQGNTEPSSALPPRLSSDRLVMLPSDCGIAPKMRFESNDSDCNADNEPRLAGNEPNKPLLHTQSHKIKGFMTKSDKTYFESFSETRRAPASHTTPNRTHADSFGLTLNSRIKQASEKNTDTECN